MSQIYIPRMCGNDSLYMDIHIIQTVPPSCVNRDDTGSPKTAYYGGKMRSRVSSQAWKRAVRKMFKEFFTEKFTGYLTKNTATLIAESICADHPDIPYENAEKMAKAVLGTVEVKKGEDKKDVLFFVSSLQVKSLAELAVAYDADKTKAEKKKKTFKPLLEKALNDNPTIDMLLFGRMAAGNANLSYDAAVQVAHSISTHEVSNEYDYFTAVDDYQPKDKPGAGHLGTTEYNSSTLYRYASVNVGDLSAKLNPDELESAVRGFAEAFIRSMPTGKQNSFANRTLPDMIYVTFRNDQPINLAGAFEKPVSDNGNGYVTESKKALTEHARNVYETYGATPDIAWTVGKDPDGLAENVNLPELLKRIEDTVNATGKNSVSTVYGNGSSEEEDE